MRLLRPAVTAATVAVLALTGACGPTHEGGSSSGPASVSRTGQPTGAGRPLVIGHRGSSATAPENTLASFALGISQGADFVESDVQRSKDGALVLMHDTTLARTTDVEQRYPRRSPWRVADFTLAEIRTLDAGSWKGARHAGAKVPTLAEAVELVRRTNTGVLMELKSPALYPGIEAQVARAFSEVPGYLPGALRSHRLVVQSFDAESLRRYHVLQPQVPVGLLGTPSVDSLPALARWADQVNPSYASFDAAYVARAHRLGLQVLAWTVNGDADMRTVLDRGVDGVITNRPDLLESVVAARRRLAVRPAA